MKAACPHHRKCSGCPRLHLTPVQQWAGKAAMVAKHLQSALPRSASGELKGLQPLVKSPLPFGYRTSAKLCLGEEVSGRRSIGLYKRDSKTVIDIPGCPVQHEQINLMLAKLFPRQKPPAAPFYIHTRGFQEGKLKFLTIRTCPETGESGLVISHTGVPRRALVQWLKILDLQRVSVFESVLTRADKDLVIGPECHHLLGKTSFCFAVAGHVFDLPPTAFFQANFSLTNRFVEHVTTWPKAGAVLTTSAPTLLDLYGGFGAYSLAAAGGFAKIYCVDGNAGAIKAAQAAATKYDYRHILPHHGSVEDFLRSHLSLGESQRVTQVIVNPPRAGLSAKVRAALGSPRLASLQRLTYVSCNPETLGQDLIELTRRGNWQVVSATPFDLFPQTEHVEVVVKLQRPGRGSF